jgi:hypothetical protein
VVLAEARQRKLEALGYWFDDRAPSAYPRPQRLVGRWPARQRAQVVAYLRAGSVFEVYRACSYCRFHCGIRPSELGRRDLTDGAWVWPEGLAHYVEAHAVRLPPRFVRRALARKRPGTVELPDHEGLIDEASWLAWGRAQGASLDLASWDRPGERDRRTIEAALAKAALPWKRPGPILLARADTREVVLALPRGRLAIVGLATPARIELLAGWDAWPRSKPASARPTPVP